jgi:tetratricopeptide (TPR) repeat protein
MAILQNLMLASVFIVWHLVVVSFSQGTIQQPAEASFERGMAAYKQKAYRVAIEELKTFVDRVSQMDSRRDAAFTALGLSYYFDGQFREAIPLLRQASERSPGNAEFAYALGIASLRSREVERAREAFARMFQLDAAAAEARLVTAKMMLSEQMEELAQKELEGARERNSRLPQLHFLLGELAIFRGDLDAAIAELKTEISLNPGFAAAYYRLGDAFTRKQMWGDAVAPLQKAIWLNPEFSSPYILLGKVYARLEQTDFAEGMLKKAISMDPNNVGARYLLGTIYRKTGRLREAQEQFEAYDKLKSQTKE